MIKYVLFFFLLPIGSLFGQDTLRVATPDLPASIHPFEMNISQKPSYAAGFLFPPMFFQDQKFQWVCYLCKEIPSSSNGLIGSGRFKGKEQVTLVFQLKDDLKWNDGVDVNAYDIHFTWQLVQAYGKELGGIIHPLQWVNKIEIDPKFPKRAVFFLDKSHAHLFHLRYLYLLPKHIEQPVWQQNKSTLEAYLKESFYHKEPHKKGLYLGSYAVKDFLPKLSRIDFESNPHASLKAPVSYLTLEKQEDLAYAIKKQDYDVISDEYPALERLSSQSKGLFTNLGVYKTAFGDTNVFEAIFLNMRSPKLLDQQVRLALFYAIDRDALMSATHSYMMPAWTMVHPQSHSFHQKLSWLWDGKQNAAQILDGSAWILNPTDKNTRIKSGKKLSFSLKAPSEPFKLLLAKKIVEQMSQIGVEVLLEEESSQYFKTHEIGRADFEDLLLATVDRPLGFSLKDMLHKDALPTIRSQYAGNNLSLWVNQRVSSLLDTHQHHLLGDGPALMEIQELVAKDVPLIPLFFYMKAVLHKPSISEIHLNPDFYPSSLLVYEWRVVVAGS